jgi:hypothetical protein
MSEVALRSAAITIAKSVAGLDLLLEQLMAAGGCSRLVAAIRKAKMAVRVMDMSAIGEPMPAVWREAADAVIGGAR